MQISGKQALELYDAAIARGEGDQVVYESERAAGVEIRRRADGGPGVTIVLQNHSALLFIDLTEPQTQHLLCLLARAIEPGSVDR